MNLKQFIEKIQKIPDPEKVKVYVQNGFSSCFSPDLELGTGKQDKDIVLVIGAKSGKPINSLKYENWEQID